ncbi:MAG: transporter [Bacteroidetes bacterium]|nr:transporter [Bacteroidota bacterium]
MWTYLVRLILRYRLVNLIVIAALTAFMAYNATKVQLSYEMTKMLPATDSTSIVYERFREQFGEDGSVFFVGIQDDNLFQKEKFNDWFDLTYSIKEVDGVQEVISLGKLYQLTRNDSLKKFDFKPIIEQKVETQEELDSIKELVYSLPFYDGLLFNKETNVSMMMITLDKDKLNTKYRVQLIYDIRDQINTFGEKHNVEVHFSGLPYIRTVTSKKVEDELQLFIYASLIIASVILLIFFRSFKAVFFTIIIVIINVVWVMGTISFLGYKITMLTGILPPLLIVIVVENCIFLLNKYHNEYKSHGNKVKGLSRVVQRIGNANLLTNTTTAAGFAAFVVTGNKILVEFGVVASINILVAFLLTLFLIPIFFSYLAPPAKKHMKHLDKSAVSKILERVVNIVQHKRVYVYSICLVFVGAAVFGASQLKTTGNIVDDIPHKDPLYVDLMFFEEHFKGVMPLEITVDTKKKKGILRLSTIKKIEKLQEVLSEYPELSRPLSLVEVVKFSKQAFYKGNEKMYDLPNNQEKNFIISYVPGLESDDKSILKSFVDKDLSITRISVQMANIGTKDIQRIMDDLRPKIDEIFNPKKFDVSVTGTSVVFLKGTNYLVKNLMSSLLLALGIICGLMALLFTSARMIGISLIPNLLPQLMTAGMMGFFAISIKPSTILIFSIALGISVDNAIHFLSRYRLQLRLNNWNIKDSVLAALRETGYSMIYSSVVLFFGFAIFTQSSFGGTEAMGYLIAFTLFVALMSNLFVLPSLLLSLDKRITTKSFKEPLLVIFDEEEDIELDDLEIESIDTRGIA